MENEELLLKVQDLEARLVAVQVCVRVLLAANPTLTAVMRETLPQIQDGLLGFALTDRQIERVTTLVQGLTSPPPPPAQR